MTDQLYNYLRREVIQQMNASTKNLEDTQKVRDFVLLYSDYVKKTLEADLAYLKGTELRDQAYNVRKAHPDWEDVLDEAAAYIDDAERLSSEAEKSFVKAQRVFPQIVRR